MLLVYHSRNGCTELSGKTGHHGCLSSLLSLAKRSSKAGCKEQASCIPLFACSLLCSLPECFSISLSHVHYPGLLADGESCVWTTGNIWFLTSSLQGVHIRVLHKLLQLPMGGEIGQLVAVSWLRKVMISISANSRKCGVNSSHSQAEGDGSEKQNWDVTPVLTDTHVSWLLQACGWGEKKS